MFHSIEFTSKSQLFRYTVTISSLFLQKYIIFKTQFQVVRRYKRSFVSCFKVIGFVVIVSLSNKAQRKTDVTIFINNFSTTISPLS